MLNPLWSNVEKCFLLKSGKKSTYNGEKVATIEVQNIYELGRLVALRFLEWVRDNPSGVVALPTGRTPEYFIKTLDLLKNNWNDPLMQQSLKEEGYIGSVKILSISLLSLPLSLLSLLSLSSLLS